MMAYSTTQNVEIHALPALRDNYIWALRRRNAVAVVDPGESRPVLEFMQVEGLRLCAILNTHHHSDHVNGNTGLLEHFDVPVFGPRDENIATVSVPLGDGDRIEIAELGLEFEVLAIPGHTAGHIAYYGANHLFCGDTLFACGCGRLFEGTPAQMSASLARLSALPAATRVYCGHEYTLANLQFAHAVEPGSPALAQRERDVRELIAAGRPSLPSTIAAERETNPFLRCDEPAIIAAAESHAGHKLGDRVAVFAALREWKNNFKP